MPQIEVTEVTLDPIVAGETFLVTRRMEAINQYGERTESTITYSAIGSVTPTGDNSLVREEAYQLQNKTIRVITTFMLRAPSKAPPQPTLSQSDYDPDIVTWRGDFYVVKNVSDYSQYGAGMIEAECAGIDYVDQAPAPITVDIPPPAWPALPPPPPIPMEVSLVGGGSLAVGTTSVQHARATLPGYGGLSAATILVGITYQDSATLAGHGGLSAATSQRHQWQASAAFGAVAGLAVSIAAPRRQWQVTATFGAVAGLQCSAVVYHHSQISASLQGVGHLIAFTTSRQRTSSTLVGSSGLTASMVKPITAGFGGSGNFLLSTTSAQQAAEQVGGQGRVSLSATQGQRTSANLVGAGGVSATGTSAQRISANFAGSGGVSASHN
jgi:hypothetical protein